MHTNQKVINEFQNNDIELQLIPKGMTSTL